MDAFRRLAHAHAIGVCRDGNTLVMVERSLVSVVDDDQSVRESLPDLLKEFGFTANAFSSAREFLASDWLEQTRCLILDIAMPGMSGPELQQELRRRGQRVPIVFITARADATTRRHLLEQSPSVMRLFLKLSAQRLKCHDYEAVLLLPGLRGLSWI
jgi:CheY-like chemotaxis protein